MVHLITLMSLVNIFWSYISTPIIRTFSAAFSPFCFFLVLCFCIVHFQSTHWVVLKAFRNTWHLYVVYTISTV